MSWKIAVIFATILLLASCKSDYTSYVETERKSGEQYDSLLFTLKLGMSKKQYFDSCWQLNIEQIIAQGDGSGNARYDIKPDSTEDKTKAITLLFKGEFDVNNVMYRMDLDYMYTSWSIWNKALQSDSLILKVKEMIMEDYGGNPWLKVDLKDVKVDTYVKIDGNRHMMMYPKDNMKVMVRIEEIEYRYGDQKNLIPIIR